MNLQTFIAHRFDYQLSSVQADRELVHDIQRHLHRLGFAPGVINGVWTRETHEAFNRFKTAHRLTDPGLTNTVARSLLQVSQQPLPTPQRELVTAGNHSNGASPTASAATPPRRPVPPPPPSMMARSKAPVVQPIVPTGQSIAYRGATPPALQRVNAQGITLIKAYERLRLEAERCPAGVLTIGYGSTADVRPGQRITARQAEARLLKDLEPFEEVIRTVVRVPLTSNQFNALVSFAFNVGTTALIASTLLKKLNQGDYPGAAEQFLHWDKAGGTPLPLLTQRRQAEQALFLKA